jgi:two-component system chemotaxis response regulator CheB
MSEKKIRVLLVDDSAFIRSMLKKFLATDPIFEVVGAAPDPYVGRDILVAEKPDVMVLDIEMPKMDGITFLAKVMEHFPTRTLIFSSLSQKGSETALQALEAGAVDVMGKPALDVQKSLGHIKDEFLQRLRACAHAKLRPPSTVKLPKVDLKSTALKHSTDKLIAIASSTGGTEALKVLLAPLPLDTPGIVVVQHMPPVFTKTYAGHLNQVTELDVREAVDGERVMSGTVLIAPGDFHMEIEKRGGYYYTKLHKEPVMHGVRPAADYLMRSVAKYVGPNALGVVLTGMGKDGAAGLKAMRDAGSYNIAQDEASCVVYGMPKAAADAGAIDKTLDLRAMPDEIIRHVKEWQRKLTAA